MLDVLFVTATLVFFALAWSYARACDSLVEGRP
jgi:hypothetical protein